MLPKYKPGDVIFASRLIYFFKKPKIGDVVVITQNKKLMVKRIKKIKDGKYFLIGDNPTSSTDSRTFGWIGRKEIIARVW
jgi:nickel-type superoxide dismutase maturation protease